ncbi:MAG: hypothetical protein JNL94_19790, partial [Planctomycetes bacterium]|nr:hypothetical protein [Planctomycetota bacterium]
CHHWGWTLLAAGLLNVIAKFFAAVSPRVEHAVQASANEIAAWSLGVGAAVLIGYAATVWCRVPGAAHADHDGASPHRSFVGWITTRPALWGWAFVIAAAPLWMSHRLGPVTTIWPDSHEWWLILTGVVLLCGGLALAWSERSFHGEDARRYGAMEQLFLCADRRLAELIPQYAEKGDKHVLDEIHDVLFQLGREALDENAEWLILHRTRPLEPFLAA